MNSLISTHVVGHIISAPRTFNLSNGVGCDFRVLITRRYYDSNGIPSTRELKVKVVTYDTVMTEQLVRGAYKMGDFIEVVADNVRVDNPWQNSKKEWVSGSVIFTIEKIRKVSALTPAAGEPVDTTATAEADILTGVVVA